MSSGPNADVAKGMTDYQIDITQINSALIAKENELRIAEELKGLVIKDRYTVTDSLRKHIETAEPVTSGRAGIKGAHNKRNFLKVIKDILAKIIKTEPNSQLIGVEKISYRMPKKDARGIPTGEYQNRIWTKTVYDSAKISTDDYLKRGIQAANNAAKEAVDGKVGREWTGMDNQGTKWHGYCNSNGDITSFYSED